MITLSTNVHDPKYLWNLDLFWFAHKQIYKENAHKKAFAAITNQNEIDSKKYDALELNIEIKHKFCDPWFKYPEISQRLKKFDLDRAIILPLNAQLALKEVLNQFDDSEIIEYVDQDVTHFRHHPEIKIDHDEFIADSIYENWHLQSRTKYKFMIDRFCSNNTLSYNGGWVPIIGTAYTFKKVIDDWINIHLEILLNRPTIEETKQLCWWGNMFAFNAVCEKRKIKVRSSNLCYFPSLHEMTDDMYICHYSVDERFNKKDYPPNKDTHWDYFEIDASKFLDNDYYNMIKKWNIHRYKEYQDKKTNRWNTKYVKRNLST